MYGLIGSVLKHSYSKEIHRCFGIENYAMYALDEAEFAAKVKEKNYLGLNITVPYKQKVIELLDELDVDARKIGAVNTIVNRNGVLTGYNTDYYGFEYLLRANEIQVAGRKVIVLGNGGVAQPVFLYLKEHHAAEVVVVKQKAEPGAITYEEALRHHSDADIIINASPVGMFPNEDRSPMTLDGYNNLTAVVDLIANPLETNLMRYAREKGILAVGGLEMLVAQAKKAEELFLDVRIKDEEIARVTGEISAMMIQNM